MLLTVQIIKKREKGQDFTFVIARNKSLQRLSKNEQYRCFKKC